MVVPPMGTSMMLSSARRVGSCCGTSGFWTGTFRLRRFAFLSEPRLGSTREHLGWGNPKPSTVAQAPERNAEKQAHVRQG